MDPLPNHFEDKEFAVVPWPDAAGYGGMLFGIGLAGFAIMMLVGIGGEPGVHGAKQALAWVLLGIGVIAAVAGGMTLVNRRAAAVVLAGVASLSVLIGLPIVGFDGLFILTLPLGVAIAAGLAYRDLKVRADWHRRFPGNN